MRLTLRRIFLLTGCLIFGLSIRIYAQDAEVKEQAKEYYLRGNIYYQQGRYKEAEEQFQKAMDLLAKEQETPGLKTEAKPAQPPQVPTLPQTQEAKGSLEYAIGEEDVLQISVWQNADLTQEVIVRPDGKISLPLIGDVQAAGLTITELDKQITESLEEYVKHPEVSISIRKLGGKKIIVLGEVVGPGVYAVTGAQSILEAIAQAGGFTKEAAASSVVLIRGGFANPQPKRINLSRALAGDIGQNVTLQSEDIVFVPKKFISDLSYFLSQVMDPISKGIAMGKQLKSY